MFTSIKLKNFRGFNELYIPELRRFNLFVGQNNVGKTALLESLFLLLGPTNPQLTLTINAFRGVEQFRTDPDDMWGWLFFEKDLNKPISLDAKVGDGSHRKLRVSIEEPPDIRLLAKKDSRNRRQYSLASSSTEPRQSQLVMKLIHESGKEVTTLSYVRDDKVSFHREEKGSLPKFPMSIFITARSSYSSENPERYSKLEELGRESSILGPLKMIEPRLKRLAVLVTGAGPVIHGDIGIGKLVPLTMMGDGIGRLVTLLLSIVSSQGGAVLIDEIDTGFHYSVLGKVWRAIANSAVENDVQLFATTHSWECISSAGEAFVGQESEFLVQRLDRIDGRVEGVAFDRSMIAEAVHSGLEVR